MLFHNSSHLPAFSPLNVMIPEPYGGGADVLFRTDLCCHVCCAAVGVCTDLSLQRAALVINCTLAFVGPFLVGPLEAGHLGKCPG